MKKFELFEHDFSSGPLWITANAGTGKTFTLVWCLLRMILEKKIAASEAVVITFTTKAANEISFRLQNLAQKIISATQDNRLLDKYFHPQEKDYLSQLKPAASKELKEINQTLVSTIHGFAWQVLRNDPLNSRFFATHELQDLAQDVLTLAIQDVWRKYNKPEYVDHLASLNNLEILFKAQYNYHNLRFIPEVATEQELANLAITDADGKRFSSALKSLMLQEIAKKYQLLKDERHLVDFKDLINRLQNLAVDNKNGAFVTRLQQKYKGLFIDEFQDTDEAQVSIAKSLFNHPDKYLFFVGDPKQSIYSFRGADLNVYLDLQSELPADKQFKLATNYRSDYLLNDAINYIFKNCADPFLEKRIEYFDSDVQKKTQDSCVTTTKDVVTAPVRFLSVLPQEALNKEKCESNIYQTIVWEIKELLQQQKIQINSQTIRPGDIAILVATNQQAYNTFKILQTAGITAFLEEKSDNSDLLASAAYQDLNNFNFLFNSQFIHNNTWLNSILISPLIGLSWHDLQDLLDEPKNYQKLAELVKKSRLIYEKQGFLAAFIFFIDAPFVDELQSSFSIERHYTNDTLYKNDLHKILTTIQEYETEHGRQSFDQAINLKQSGLKNLFFSMPSDDGRGRIKIMTYHKAKGLEFPVIIAPFLWHQNLSYSQAIYHEQDGWVLNLNDLNDADKNNLSKEQCKQQRRIIYTALTRAKSLITIMIPNYEMRFKYQKVSDLELLLSNNQAAAGGDIFQWLDKFCQQKPELFNHQEITSAQLSGKINLKDISVNFVEQAPAVAKDEGDLFYHNLRNNFLSLINKEKEPTAAQLCRADPLIISFSALNAGKSYEEDQGALKFATTPDLPLGALNLIGEAPKVKITGSIEADDASATDIQKLPDFPGSIKTGLFFHDLLANWDYQKYDTINFSDRISIAERLSAQFSHLNIDQQAMLVTTTKDHLAHLRNLVFESSARPSFNLCALPPENIMREWQFYTHYSKNWDNFWKKISRHDLISETATTTSIQTRTPPDRYLTGAIDLLVQNEGYYYIIDWKTNLLPDYSKSDLASDFKKREYFKQVLLYTFALKTYFNKVAQKDFSNSFGGCFYVYLRGLANKKGIFYIAPETILEALSLL